MIAIVGGSIAAFVAYKTVKRLQPDVDVKVFSKEKTSPYSKMLLPYMLTSNVEKTMFYEIGDDLILEREIVEIDAGEKYIKDNANWKYYFDKAIIATGADAKTVEFGGEYDAKRIITIRYLDDIYRIRSLIREAKLRRVVVVGAGLVSMEIAHALALAGFGITFVVGSNRILSQILNKSSADFVEKVITDRFANVEFYKQNGVESIENSRNSLLVKLKDGGFVECDFVVVGRGVNPNASFFKDGDDGIEVDNFLKTRFDGVYAVGDVAKSSDAISGEKTIHAIWPVAVEQAEIAAKNVLGAKIEEKLQVSRNVVPVFGMNIFTGGLSKLEEYDDILEDRTDGIRRVLLRDGFLDGFVFVADRVDFGRYVDIMRSRKRVKGAERGLLFSTDFVNL